MENNNSIKHAVILAAGERKEFDKPVGFLDIEETSIIERTINSLNENGIKKITVVIGYKQSYFEELAKKKSLNLVVNENYKWTGTMYSLSLASNYIEEDFLLIEGDNIFEEQALKQLLNKNQNNCILITSESGSGVESLVEIRDNYIYKISKDIRQLNKVDGEFVGLTKISYSAYLAMLQDFAENENSYTSYEYVLLDNKENHKVTYEKIDSLVWADINTQSNYEKLKYVVYPKLKRKELSLRKDEMITLLNASIGIEKEEISDVKKLGGLTNSNYKVRFNNQDYVARVPGLGTSEIIDRKNEKFNSEIAYRIGIDPKTIYFNSQSGFKITEYVEHAETLNSTTAKKPENMKMMSDIFKRLHNHGEKFQVDFNPFNDLMFYEKTLLDANGKLFDDYYDVKALFMSLEKELMELGMESVPCHLDALAENFIKSGEDKMCLIDWEYSGNYDKLWDVTSIMVESNYSKDEESLFLNNYFAREPNENEINIITIHKITQDILWSIWSAAKVALGDPVLAQYSRDRYNNGRKNLHLYFQIKK